MVHGRSVRQILRLFNRIYDPEDYFYIHVDTRSQYLFDQLKHLENEQNVIVTENRFSPIWGGASLLQMMLNSMKEMLNVEWKFDFFINLSGTDYVLKHPKEMKHYLSDKIGMNFVYADHKDVLQSRMNSKYFKKYFD